MSYMTFGQQVDQHLQFLQKEGLDVVDLRIDSQEFIRALTKGEQGRGEYSYKTMLRKLDNGMTGLITWCRGQTGQVSTYKTYGYPSDSVENRHPVDVAHQNLFQAIEESKTCFDVDVGRIEKFWEFSSQHGESDYLKRKGVGAYGVRFRDNQYGKVAVVPLRDIHKRLRGYQILNANGSKVFAKGIRLSGLFHQLTDLLDGLPIGVAESYVTAATCLELIGISIVTAFTGNNLGTVVVALRQRYPNSPLVIFADNDSHLRENKGLRSAVEALKQIQGEGAIVLPRFDQAPCVRDCSDWNDLVREIGYTKALEQMQNSLSSAQNERIKRWVSERNKDVAS